jgi:hypothetical protein
MNLPDLLRDLIAQHGVELVEPQTGQAAPLRDLLTQLGEAKDPAAVADICFRIGFLTCDAHDRRWRIAGVERQMFKDKQRQRNIEAGEYAEEYRAFSVFLSTAFRPGEGKPPSVRSLAHRFLAARGADPGRDAGLERMLREVAAEHIRAVSAVHPWPKRQRKQV